MKQRRDDHDDLTMTEILIAVCGALLIIGIIMYYVLERLYAS